jgi:hypothetical protein
MYAGGDQSAEDAQTFPITKVRIFQQVNFHFFDTFNSIEIDNFSTSYPTGTGILNEQDHSRLTVMVQQKTQKLGLIQFEKGYGYCFLCIAPVPPQYCFLCNPPLIQQ